MSEETREALARVIYNNYIDAVWEEPAKQSDVLADALLPIVDRLVGDALREAADVRMITRYLYSVGAAKPDTWARELVQLLTPPGGTDD